jgi:hypothetical protein
MPRSVEFRVEQLEAVIGPTPALDEREGRLEEIRRYFEEQRKYERLPVAGKIETLERKLEDLPRVRRWARREVEIELQWLKHTISDQQYYVARLWLNDDRFRRKYVCRRGRRIGAIPTHSDALQLIQDGMFADREWLLPQQLRPVPKRGPVIATVVPKLAGPRVNSSHPHFEGRNVIDKLDGYRDDEQRGRELMFALERY